MGAKMCPLCAAEKTDYIFDGTDFGLRLVDDYNGHTHGYNWDDVDKLVVNIIKERNKYLKALERIPGMCGAPDAGRACRNVIAFVQETLK